MPDEATSGLFDLCSIFFDWKVGLPIFYLINMKGHIILAVALAAGAAAHADIAYSSFGTSLSFSSSAKIISGSSTGFGLDTDGYQFTSLKSGTVSDILVAAGGFLGDSTMTFKVYTDNAGVLGTQLFSKTLSFTNPTVVTSLSPANSFSVSAGSKYWIVGSAAASGVDVWNYSNAAQSKAYQLNGSGVNYYDPASQGAFQVETQSVPEPITLIGLPIALVFILRRKAN